MLFSIMLTPLEKLLNYYLQLDPESKPRLAMLAGRVIAVELQNFGYQIYWLINNDGITLTDTHAGLVDVTLRGSPFDFLRVSASGSNSSAMINSNITLLGDTEVAQQFKALFANLDIDWEEQLSRLTGDVIARQAVNFLRTVSDWAKKTSTTLQQNFTEYAQEEARWLPPREELQDFFTNIDHLRNDTERMALKLARLAQKYETF